MKNFLMAFMVLGMFALTSCGGDDDCQTCTNGADVTKYCDIGDGNIERTVGTTIDTITGVLATLTADAVTAGATCE